MSANCQKVLRRHRQNPVIFKWNIYMTLRRYKKQRKKA